MKNKKGFTLVELLAVIVILIVITLFALNKISEVMKKIIKNIFHFVIHLIMIEFAAKLQQMRLSHYNLCFIY